MLVSSGLVRLDVDVRDKPGHDEAGRWVGAVSPGHITYQL